MKIHNEDCECCSEGRAVFRKNLDENIRKYGVSIIGTKAEAAHGTLNMSYTIGLSDSGFPEILAFGLPNDAALVLLNDAAVRMREGHLPLSAYP